MASAQAIAARAMSARPIAANSALKNQGSGHENFHANAFGGGCSRRRRLCGRWKSGFSRVPPRFSRHELRSGPGFCTFPAHGPDSETFAGDVPPDVANRLLKSNSALVAGDVMDKAASVAPLIRTSKIRI
jgi:hypothetical protein